MTTKSGLPPWANREDRLEEVLEFILIYGFRRPVPGVGEENEVTMRIQFKFIPREVKIDGSSY